MIFNAAVFSVSAEENGIDLFDTDVELDEYGLGAIIDENDVCEYNVDCDETLYSMQNVAETYDLPSTVDLSTENAFPCIRSQGDVGSCASWASTYYQFGYQVAKKAGWNAKNNPTKQFSPKFVYNLVNNGDDNGSSLSNNYKVLKSRGAVKYYQFAPNPNTSQNPDPLDNSKLNPLEYRKWCTDVYSQKEALMYKVLEYQERFFSPLYTSTPITNINSSYLATIKNLLSTGHVLTFSTSYGKQESIDDSSIIPGYSSGNSNIDWIYKKLSNNEKVCIAGKNVSFPKYNKYYRHALSIVGYDDSIWYDYDEDGEQDAYEMGAFKIANSHGGGYGNSGFIWIMYDAFNKVSNCPLYNENRLPIMIDNTYYSIEVKLSNRDLLAYVSLSQNMRNQHLLKLSSLDSSNSLVTNSFLEKRGGNYCYDGTQSTNYQSATFVMDFDIVVSGNRDWRHYQIEISDFLSNPTTYISDITIVDRTGKIILSESYNANISNRSETLDYYIGLVGDVNNDSNVDVLDSTVIQKHLAGIITLTDEQILVADVDGDGLITSTDANYIILYSTDVITDFANGAFVNLS